MMTLESLKLHVETYISTVDAEFASKWSTVVAWAEGKQAELDQDAAAVALLQSHGYTVTKT
jgi:hypothetical protein